MFSTQAFEHKNKITKQDYHRNSSKGGGYQNSTGVGQQLLEHDEVRFNLMFLPGVAQQILPLECTSIYYLFNCS